MMDLKEEDRLISDFLHAIGPWHRHVIIGGGYAPIIYKLYLADKGLKFFPVGTRDIDVLIPRKVPMISEKPLAQYLEEASFNQVFKGRGIPATEAYVKTIDGVEVEIEFLTDAAVRVRKDQNIAIAGIVAQPLSYLTLSLQTMIPFQTYSKKEGRVVAPEAWVFHKGLTFTRRKNSFKSYKDLYGIWYVATQLGEFSKKTRESFCTLRLSHSRWFKTFKKNLEGWVGKASPLDWLNLETQDPHGRLKKLNFETVIEQLVKG